MYHYKKNNNNIVFFKIRYIIFIIDVDRRLITNR